jgi:hypothetical protein
MRVTAKEILAAWVELDRESPYHTEQKPIGVDRKTHEGPIATNEEFKNTWLPTGTETAPEEMVVEQIEVVKVEIAAKRADRETIPGVSEHLFRSWEQAHDAQLEFAGSYNAETLERFIHYLLQFAKEASRAGLRIDPEHMERLKDYPRTHRPDRGDEYSIPRAQEILDSLDKVLGNLHSGVAHLSGTDKDEWYAYQAEQMKDRPVPIQELREQRGPMAPFLEEAWERKKKHELRGRRAMKITAADVLPFDPNKRRLKDVPTGPRKGPQRVEAPGMEEAFQADNAGMEEAYDYEGLLYMFDTAAGGLNDIAEALIRVQPSLDPTKQREAGAIIAKIKAAVRALSA